MYPRFRKLFAALTPAVAATLILALAAAGMPAAAQEVREPAPAAPSALLQSIDRAVEAAGKASQDDVGAAALSAGERADLSRRAGRLKADPVAGQASGGGKGRIILAVLGLAVSVGTTYYYLKFMKQQQEKEQK